MLDQHVATCKFTQVPCPKECKQIIRRKDLEKHLNEHCLKREYQCKYCGRRDMYINITGIHDNICERKILPCPNAECVETVERAKINMHLENDSEYALISCMYESIGCDVKLKRKDMGAHEQDDKAHLHQALNTVVKLQGDLQSLKVFKASAKKEREHLAVQMKRENAMRLESAMKSVALTEKAWQTS